jgi:hypothetical protein
MQVKAIPGKVKLTDVYLKQFSKAFLSLLRSGKGFRMKVENNQSYEIVFRKLNVICAMQLL